MKVPTKVLIVLLLILSLVFMKAYGYDARESLEAMQEDLIPYVTECYNVKAELIEIDYQCDRGLGCSSRAIRIEQLCPFGTETMYGEMKKTIWIDLIEQKFYRMQGWNLPSKLF